MFVSVLLIHCSFVFFLVLHLIVRSCAVGAVLVALERVGSTSVARNPCAPGCFAQTVVLIASLSMLVKRAPRRYGAIRLLGRQAGPAPWPC